MLYEYLKVSGVLVISVDVSAQVSTGVQAGFKVEQGLK